MNIECCVWGGGSSGRKRWIHEETEKGRKFNTFFCLLSFHRALIYSVFIFFLAKFNSINSWKNKLKSWFLKVKSSTLKKTECFTKSVEFSVCLSATINSNHNYKRENIPNRIILDNSLSVSETRTHLQTRTAPRSMFSNCKNVNCIVRKFK